MEDELNSTPVEASPITSDPAIWESILHIKLDGVMMHVELFKFFLKNDIPGYAAMHCHHAREEFATYLHILNDFITTYKKIPSDFNFSSPVVKIDGATKEEIMSNGMETYEKWEKGVHSKIKSLEVNLKEGKEHADRILEDVNFEIKYIHLMQNDLVDEKYCELDKWLLNKYK